MACREGDEVNEWGGGVTSTWNLYRRCANNKKKKNSIVRQLWRNPNQGVSPSQRPLIATNGMVVAVMGQHLRVVPLKMALSQQ